MIIGVSREVKDHETRVALVPSGVTALAEAGHEVLVESAAGEGSALPAAGYAAAVAFIVPTAGEVWRRADLVLKVKEPQPAEYEFLRPGLILFTYLHLAPLPELTTRLLEAGVSAVADETIRERDGSLPLLTPMSEVAGRLAVQIGARYLEAPSGGRGVLLGGGVAGHNAAKVAYGMGAHVTILDKNLNRLRELDDIFNSQVVTLDSNLYTVREAVRQADLVIGAVLIPGAAAPKLVRRDMLPAMKRGAVMVDISIDQGGCFETSHPTTHSNPVYTIDEVLHYCVSNMPAAVPHTSTFALTNATFPYLAQLASQGLERACEENPALAQGVNTYQGAVVHPAVAESQNRPWKELAAVL